LRAAAALVVAGLTLAAPAPAAPAPTEPVAIPPPHLTERRAVRIFLSTPKVANWLARYDRQPTSDAELEAAGGRWRVHVWAGRAGEVATGRVDDATGALLEAWTGPQVAWKMARGTPGAFGGKVLLSLPVWVVLCGIFFLVVGDPRRPLSLRNLDVLVLLSFSVSLVFFQRGEIFRSVPLAYPPLLYLAARTAWIGFRGRPVRARAPVWPVWLLAALAVFLAGFRVGLNIEARHGVIDVGYAGVIGADRILDGRAPYGTMPDTDDLPACGPADADGFVRNRIQPDGRCEGANPRGDTYGPFAYLAYVPAVAALGWSGTWDRLPAAHATAILFDLLAVIGLVLVGRRFGGRRLAATLAVAWLAYPFTAYALVASTNDAIMAAALVWGFWLVSSPAARGAAVALAGWTKFAALLVAPLWLTYPHGPRRRTAPRFLWGFLGASLAVLWVVWLEPGLTEPARTFWERTVEFQLERESPFSLWGWGQYHAAGIPDLGFLQPVAQVAALALAGVAAVLPREKTPLRLAALTAAILLAVQVTLTHWFYLYLPWALPFVVLALLLPEEEG
jgi:hypothetical protein